MTKPNLAFRSHVPPVTNVWNREYAVQRLTGELALARQECGYRFSILLVQLEGFGTAGRERLGFASGNDLAPRVFSVLTQGLRDNEVCCHLAGDEFLLILPHRGELECRELAGILRLAWSPKPGTREVGIVLRVGWATSSAEGSTIEEMFAAADESLADRDRRESQPPVLAGLSLGGQAASLVAQRQVPVGRS
ncbi:MAG: diguanylate cyclase [Pseudomonadota bacterium]